MHDIHECDLQRTSESCIPGLPLYASPLQKFYRRIKKIMILSPAHLTTKKCFRSHFAIIAERARHSSTGYSFVIHPFSLFELLRTYVLCIAWILLFLLDPFILTYFETSGSINAWWILQGVLDSVMFINILLTFIIGYYVPLTKEIVLRPTQIWKHYLRTYFFFDFVACLPYNLIINCFDFESTKTRFQYIGALKYFRFVRVPTMMSYLFDLLTRMGLGDAVSNSIVFLSLTYFLIHWWGCILYGFPLFFYTADGLPAESWINEANLSPSNKSSNSYHALIVSLVSATSHFYGATEGRYPIEISLEKIIGALIAMSGCFYCTFLLATALQVFGSINIAESKYDELVYQLREYSRAKNLPEPLQQRLFIYYEYKFQKRFFKEDTILNTLSEHLRYEILLYSCRHIIEKVMALQGLSKSVVGGLIANFKLEVFLQNDVIIKHSDPPLKLYFISHGTVAVFLPSGQEITHHEDGDFFGSTLDKLQIPVNIVAAEITETFSMSKSDAKYIFKLEKDVADRIIKLQTMKEDEYKTLANIHRDGDHKSVLDELRKGNILEKLRLR